jgi:TetR/AcrR family transcriptional regulator
LFAKHGFEAVPITEIAKRSGVSKANIFHHFPNKRELYMAVLQSACRSAIDPLQHLEARDGGFHQRFTAYADDMLQSMLDHKALHRLALRELLAEKDVQLAKELAEKVFGDRFVRLVTILRTGQTHGELRSDFDPVVAAIALIGANVFFIQCQNVFEHFPDVRSAANPKRYAKSLTDILLRGIMSSP